MNNRILVVLIILFGCSAISGQNTNNQKEEKVPRIYVSGSYTDMQYLKTQIPVVDYVNDQKDADVHIFITSLETGGGGTQYILHYYGQNRFKAMNDTMEVFTEQNDTEDAVREKLCIGMKAGLIRYLKSSTVADKLRIDFAKEETHSITKRDDPWDSWVLGTGLNMDLNGQAAMRLLALNGFLTANRSTEDLRVSLNLSSTYVQSIYTYDVDGGKYEYMNIQREQNLGGSLVKSISDHWSLGAWGSVYSNSYANLDLVWTMKAGIEYNFFPYSEASREQLTLSYRAGIVNNNYCQETIYFKNREHLGLQSMYLNLSLKKPWGSASIGLEGRNFFNDLSKYALSLDFSVSLRLIKGLSLNLNGYASRINNQINVPRQGATVEDVLLQRRQLETQYRYSASVGISYSFGSIFNNIVNTRFPVTFN